MKGVFFKAEFTIHHVKRSEQTIQTYEDIELFNIISREVKGNNYHVLKHLKKRHILDSARQSYPFLSNIDFQLEAGNTLGIDLHFTPPLFKVKL